MPAWQQGMWLRREGYEMKEELHDFQIALNHTQDPVAAALLVLSRRMEDLWNSDLGRQICLGIRHGIFGGECNEEQDIRHLSIVTHKGEDV